MRLGLMLTVSLLSMALLVGALGLLLEKTSDAIGDELDELRRSSIQEVLGADGMDRALQAAQAAAYRLLAERYRERSEISHESGTEWGAVGDLDLGSVDERLEDFQGALELSRQAVAAADEIARRLGPNGVSDRQAQHRRLRDIESAFSVHKQLLERLVHLMRYHPNEHVREFLQEEVEPHYESAMAPPIRDFAAAARTDLLAATEAVERLVAKATTRNRWVTGVAFVLALIYGLLLTGSISRPLGRLHEAALRVGAGELEHHVDVRGANEIGDLAAAFNQMADNLRASTVSRSFLDNILQSMREIVLVADSEGTVQIANQVATSELGDDTHGLLGRTAGDFIVGDLEEMLAGAGEVELMRFDGSSFPASYTRSDLKSPGRDSEGFVLVARDITQRRQDEEMLKRSLHEKDILLKEVHHRVKNNLQIISSLLRLQEGDTGETTRGLRESQNRIRSMALIHEHLYQSTDLANIDFGAYLRQLVANLLASYGAKTQAIHSEVEVSSGPLDLDAAIPCGMIVNELVANAVEHAFGDGPGKLWVSFTPENGNRVLTVANDGARLPEDFEIGQTTSLGLRLVSALTDQLHGELRFASLDDRTEFSIHLSSPEGRPS